MAGGLDLTHGDGFLGLARLTRLSNLQAAKHKLIIYVVRPTKPALPLAKLTNLSSQGKVG